MHAHKCCTCTTDGCLCSIQNMHIAHANEGQKSGKRTHLMQGPAQESARVREAETLGLEGGQQR